MDNPNVHAPRFICIDTTAGPDASTAMIAAANHVIVSKRLAFALPPKVDMGVQP